MEARIDDETIRYDINPEVLIRFGQLDDANRLKLFDSVFHEVMIKNADGKDTDNRVDGAALSKMKEVMGFYHNVDNGREVDVTEVRVDRSEDGQYLMSATINGKERTKEILERPRRLLGLLRGLPSLPSSPDPRSPQAHLSSQHLHVPSVDPPGFLNSWIIDPSVP